VSNESFEKYDIPSVPPKLPAGKGEIIDTELYESGARMVGFKVRNKQRLVSWIKAIIFRYHNQMGSFQEFHCDWTDMLRRNSDSRIDEIRIQLFNESKSAKYLTIHIYLTTFLLTFQGLDYLTCASEEFDYMKSIVDAQDTTT